MCLFSEKVLVIFLLFSANHLFLKIENKCDCQFYLDDLFAIKMRSDKDASEQIRDKIMTKKKVKPNSNTIALNKRCKTRLFIEDEIEAGLELQGWEVKSVRATKANISDSYVIFKMAKPFVPAQAFSH